MLYKLHEVKRFSDNRGYVVNQPWDSPCVELSKIHLFSIEPDCIRGNHYHPSRDEWLFLFNGRARGILSRQDDREEIILSGGEGYWLQVLEGVAHSLITIGKEATFWFAGSKDRSDMEGEDTVKINLLP